MSDTLLHTKLMAPRLQPTMIPREDLLARLDAGLSKKLTVVSAPNGFGKTTLVCMWIASRKFPIAWVTLDENDNDPSRFWTYLVSALRTFDPAVGRTALSLLSTAQSPSFQSFLTLLINDFSQLVEPCVLVLDDYHAIISNEIKEGLSFFSCTSQESLHVVLTTRTEPDLPLPLLRVRDELIEVNTSNLRFSPQEAEQFLSQSLQADLSSAVITQLFEKTEGWAAGLRLIALSLRKKGLANIETLAGAVSGSDRYVADYLIKEVFESQPEAIQEFLLKTCFLNRFTDELCNSVTGAGDGAVTLEGLERENLFLVQLEHGRGQAWYRYNPLFAESMQALARARLGETGVQSIFEKASAWFEYQQLFDDAIEMSLSAGLFERSLALIEKFIQIYDLNEMGTLTRWMEKIPQALTLQRPSVCMMYAQVILFTSDRYAPATAVRIEPYLKAAEDVWKSQGNEEKIGTVFALRGMMLLWQGEYQRSLAFIHQALEKMPESEVFWRGVSLLNAAGGELYAGHILSAQEKILEARALLGASQNIHGMLAATGMLSDIFLSQGDLELCAQLNQQIIEEAVGDVSMLDDQGHAQLNLAYVAYEQNELDSAEQHAALAFEYAKQRVNELLQSQAMGQLALIHFARGQTAEASDELRALEAGLQTSLALREIYTAQAWIAARSGARDIPNGWITPDPNSFPLQKEREAFILARLKLANDLPAEALAMLEPYLADAAVYGRVRSQVELLLLVALAHHAQSNLSRAIGPLGDALTLGNTKGLRRTFLDEGPRLASLLQAASPTLPNRTVGLFATTLLHLFSPGKSSSDRVLIEPLSQQEIRVLKLLVAGLSNGEIASELVVSTNTVKTHVKSIYRKFSINSREEARTIAREMKLF